MPRARLLSRTPQSEQPEKAARTDDLCRVSQVEAGEASLSGPVSEQPVRGGTDSGIRERAPATSAGAWPWFSVPSPTGQYDLTDMPVIRKKNFSTPDIERDVGRGQLRIVELGDVAIGIIEYQPGWSWLEDLKDRVGTETCQIRHMGVALSGRLGITMDDGSSFVIEPMDAFDVPAGHLAHVIGDEPWRSIDTVGRRNFGAPAREDFDRYIATILFVDIVGSTELVRRLGDRAWRELLTEHNAGVRAVLERHRGVEIGTIGDGFLATFGSAYHAVRAARDIGRAAADLDLQVRAGLHTGEVERAGDDVRGIAVHHASRVAGEAGPGEILVSSSTRALLRGSEIVLEPIGRRALKGIEEPDELFRVEEPSS
jgi:class 3 adenylate cyclase